MTYAGVSFALATVLGGGRTAKFASSPRRRLRRSPFQLRGHQPGVLSSKANSKALASTGTVASKAYSALWRKVLVLALPALGALCLDPLMSIVDTMCIGRWAGSTPLPLAAAGAASTVAGATFALFNFLSAAVPPLVASRLSANAEVEEASSIAGQVLTLAVAMGVSVMIGLFIYGHRMLAAIGTEAAGTTDLAAAILRIRASAAPAVFTMYAAAGILRGCLDNFTPFCILAAATTLNVMLELALVFGCGWGPIGAALATASSQFCTAFAFLFVLNRGVAISGRSRFRVQFSRSMPPKKEVVRLLTAFTSVCGRNAALNFSFTTAASLAAFGGGAASAAAHQVAMQLWVLCAFIANSLKVAAQALVAQAFGREDHAEARRIAAAVASYGLMLGCILSSVIFALVRSGTFPGVLTSDPHTIMAIQPVLPLLILAQPLNAVVFASEGMIEGAQDFSFQFWSMLLALAAGGSCVAFLPGLRGCAFPRLFDVWMALIAMNMARGLATTWRYALNARSPLHVSFDRK